MEGNCPNCLWWFVGTKTCLAFPEGIPDDIWRGNVNHTEPYEGDAGIVFEQYDEALVATGEL